MQFTVHVFTLLQMHRAYTDTDSQIHVDLLVSLE